MTMGTGEIAVSHIGFTVTDLDAMTAFYVNALGFIQWFEGAIPSSFHALHRLAPDMKMFVRLFAKGPMNLELVSLAAPQAVPAATRPINVQGFALLAFAVPALDPVMEAVAACGGEVLRDTRIAQDGREIVMCLDPEGNRIELIANGAATTAAPQ